MKKKIIIIGAGAAGIGLGIIFKKMNLDFLIIDKGIVGESFLRWSEGTQLISPSFTGNFFGAPDLNSVSPNTSPAYLLETEHPSGGQYADYLQALADFFELPLKLLSSVEHIEKKGKEFEITLAKEKIFCDYVIWAGGEFQFPRKNVCTGWENAIHNTEINNLNTLSGEVFHIIGGYESGFDTAIQLARLGKKSIIFDSQNHLQEERSDASFSLSPFTKSRYKKYQKFIEIRPFSKIKEIKKDNDNYQIITQKQKIFESETQPILATGFDVSQSHIRDTFSWKDGSPLITENDESTLVPNFFLSGPQVKHKKVIFCFIYKFRQRFAIIAETIVERLGISDDPLVQKTLNEYKKGNFYLKDLSCCENECIC